MKRSNLCPAALVAQEPRLAALIAAAGNRPQIGWDIAAWIDASCM